MVYWTDVAGRTISRASLEPGAEPETIITSGQQLPSEDICVYLTLLISSYLPILYQSPIFIQQGRLSSTQVTLLICTTAAHINKHIPIEGMRKWFLQ